MSICKYNFIALLILLPFFSSAIDTLKTTGRTALMQKDLVQGLMSLGFKALPELSTISSEDTVSLIQKKGLNTFTYLYMPVDYQKHAYKDKDGSIQYPYHVYEQFYKHLSQETGLDYVLNQRVLNFLRVYSFKIKRQTREMLGASTFYYPIFEQAMWNNGVPDMLKHLAIIESALDPNAVSRVGATGLWQFMYATAEFNKMEMNDYVDERKDAYKSSEGAARYLKHLHDQFDDWFLAVAGYNCGPGNVRKAIRKAGGKKGIWEIYEHLPRETRGYVPAFIAASLVMTYPQLFEIEPGQSSVNTYAIDTVKVNKRISLKEMGERIGVTEKQLQELNPYLKRSVLPADYEGHIFLPADTKFTYKINEQSIVEASKSAPDGVELSPNNHFSSSSGTKVVYTVKSGDNLGYIAEWYNCKAKDIRLWNDIRGSFLKLNQKLRIYVPKSKLSYYQKINSLSFAQKNDLNKKKKYSDPNYVDCERDDGKYVLHKVKEGETLWSISNQYPDVSLEQLKASNKVNHKALKIGDCLKIRI